MIKGHPEPSAAESKDPVEFPFGSAAGFLDFARNDRPLSRHLSLGFPSSFILADVVEKITYR
jgi:hypothetical protein